MPATSHRARKTRQTTQRQIETVRALAEDLKKYQLQAAERPPSPSLADFGAAADLSPIPLALLSRGGTILAASRALFTLFGARSYQLLFQSLVEFLPREEVSAFFKFLSKCERTRVTRRAEFSMTVPGCPVKEILLIVSPADTIDLQQTLFRAAFVDLSESEARDFGPRLPQEDARLMEAIDGIVWEAISPMRFTFVSRQAERMLGFPVESWLSDPEFWEKHIYHEDRDRVVQARAEAVRKPSSHVLEYRMVTAQREIIWVKDSAVMLAGAPGWAKMCGIITDVTDVQHARENLAQANQDLEAAVAERTAKMEQSLEAMETLCYGIAHDLKAPLRGLQGFVSILSTDYDKVFDDTAKQYTQRCQAALRRMAELIEAVLAYGRLNHTLPELIPIHTKPLVDRVLQSFQQDFLEKKARVQVQMSLPAVIGNPYLLEQVFTNLIANALKFAKPDMPPEISIFGTEGGRSVEDRTLVPEPPSQSSSHPSIDSSSSWARLTVTDNGIGIAPEFNKRMFGMFQKLHRNDQYPGTGIGLAVVKRAVELMNGQVGVFSEPGQGSSFWIELPSI